jgi:hypothetical protein
MALQPTLESVMASIPYILTPYLTIGDAANMAPICRSINRSVARLIEQYTDVMIRPRITVAIEDTVVQIERVVISTVRGRTRIQCILRNPRYLMCMPGNHTIRVTYPFGHCPFETTHNLLYHNFNTGSKSFLISAPERALSANRMTLQWVDAFCSMRNIDSNIIPTPLTPPLTISRFGDTYGYTTLEMVVRYIKDIRKYRGEVDSIPAIQQVTIDVPNQRDSTSFLETSAGYLLYVALTNTIMLGVAVGPSIIFGKLVFYVMGPPESWSWMR